MSEFSFNDNTVLQVDVLLPVMLNNSIQLTPCSLYLVVDSTDTLEHVNVMVNRLNPNATVQDVSIVEDTTKEIQLVNQDGSINVVTIQTFIDNRKELYK